MPNGSKWIQMDAGLLPTLVSEQILAHDVQLYGPVLYLKLAWPFHHFPRRSPSPKEIMAKGDPFPWSTMVHQPADCDELATAEAHDDLLTALLTRFMTFNTCIWKLPHNQGQAWCFPSKRPVPKTCVPVTCPWTSAMPAHPRHTAPTLENDAIHWQYISLWIQNRVCYSGKRPKKEQKEEEEPFAIIVKWW